VPFKLDVVKKAPHHNTVYSEPLSGRLFIRSLTSICWCWTVMQAVTRGHHTPTDSD